MMADADARPSVLWIDDHARGQLVGLLTQVRVDETFAIEIAESVTEAIEQLASARFDVVIFDLNLPAGDDPAWGRVHRQNGTHGLMGFRLLQHLFGPADPADRPIRWLSPGQCAILSIEPRDFFVRKIEPLGIRHYRSKGLYVPEDTIIDLATEVLDGEPWS